MKNMKNRLLNILFNNNKDIFIKKFKGNKKTIMVAAIIVLGVVYSLGFGTIAYKYATVANNSYLDGSSKYDRISDNNTMESYKGQLIDEDPNGRGSRYAGRVWADKSVEANNAKGTFNLGLKEEDDGVTTNVGLNTDFLHIFSTLGSSQVVDRESTRPLDVVLLLDISGSMTRLTNNNMDSNDSLHKVLSEANTLIDQLMGNDPDHPVHPDNRVGVIVYGGGAQQLLALSHYTPSSSAEGIGQYMRISGKTNKGKSAYFPRIQSNVKEGNQVTTKVMQADSTYLQGALYKGMKMLADEETTTYRNTVTGKEEARIPVLITLTDGATNIVSTTKSSNGGNTSYEWWEPFHEDVISTAGEGLQYAANASNPFYADCSTVTGYYNNSDARNTRDNKLVKEPQMISLRNVSNLLLAGYYQKKIQAHYNTDMKNYSIGFNVNNLGEFANEQLLGTLSPKEYFDQDRKIDFTYLHSKTPQGQWLARETEINEFAKAQVENTKELLQSYIAGSNPTAKFPEEGYYRYLADGNAEFTWKHPEDSEYDVKSLDDVNYIDKYYTATDGDIANIFDQIFDEMLGSTFNPIEGDNDSGVSDSLTYMDPIGKYMEVKDKGVTLADNKQYDLGLLLFGQMHGMVKTGIYDYNTNLKIQKQFGSFEMGWYYLDPKTGQYVKNRENASWSNGDIYYLDGDTTRQYVSTLPENVDSAPEEQRNKVYTIYRFDKNITTGKTEDTAARAVLHDNPCYKSGEVQYALNEIRVWVEDSGDYTGGTGGSVIDNGYDSMIYVNIPSRALPIQTANIKLNVDGTVKKYSTNLSDKKQSTPFRLFYGIGVSDDIKTEDKLDIDLAKVSAEYIQSHTDADGNVYFLSNYYSGTNYDGYVTDSNKSRSRGDANFTFSPSADNRYYAFQRPLTLYELNEEDYVNSDGVTVDYTATKVFKTSTGKNGLESFENNHKKVESVSSNKAYWIIIDYYLPENNETVHMAVKRRGSELGSYLGEDKTGEFLVWYNPETGEIKDFVNNVKPVDGYYVAATKVGGLRTGDMAQNVHTKQSNKTGSAGTYYLPTASTNSDSKNIVVDGYLGNNGRLTVSDALLEVTKEVEPEPDVLPDGTGKEKFNYTLSFENGVHTGDFQAIKTFKNPYSGKWQLRLSTIDLLTDERGLLQTEDNQLATDENGNYIYVGGNTDEHVFHLYNAADNDIAGSEQRAGRTVYVNSLEGLTDSVDGRVLYRPDTKDHPAGSMEFWVKDVYIVPKDQLDTFDGKTTDGLQQVGPFVAADIDSNRQMKVTPSSTSTYAQPQKAQVYSKYATNTQYLTETLDFKKDESTGKYVAKFSLGHNEGLVINGLEKDYKYTVEEVLTEGQIQNGYRFDRAYGDTEIDLLEPEAAGTARFGNTVQKENEVHYVNRSLNALSIVKTLKGLDSRTDTNRDWNFTVKLKRGTADKVGGEYYYVVTKDNKVTRTGNINFESTDGGYTYTADFAIKGGEKMTIYGILDGTEYTITEKEAGQIKGYTTTVKGNNNEGTLIRDAEVEFINNNPAEYDITLGKIVEGFAGDKEKTWNFDITLTAPEGEGIPTEYVCEGEACLTSKIQFNKQEDNTYKATVQLKHGEGITIKDLLEGTTYKIVEQEADSDDYTTSHSGKASGTFGTGGVTTDQTVTFTNTKYSYHDLTVGKLVKGEDGDEEATWTFNIYLTPAQGITLDDSYEYKGGVIAGYEGKVTAPADGEITFTKVTGDRRGSYMGTVSVKHGQKVTIKGLPERTRYFVSEINSNRDGYTALIPQQTGSFDSEGASGEVIITNVNLSEHDLIIEKQVEGTDGNRTKDWHFTVTLTPDKTTGIDFPKEYPTTLNGADSTNITFTETPEGSGVYVGHVTLKHNDKLRIKGLPEGTKYQVTEDEADKDQYLTNHTDNTSGTLENATDTQHIIYRNIKLAKQTLTLSKEVLGGAGEYEKPWEFVIKLSREDDIELGKFNPETSKTTVTYPSEGTSKIEGVEAPSIDNVTFEKQEDGSYVAKVKLKHGQALTINDIPENTNYEISETDANTGRYVTYTNGETSGTITNVEGDGITFYNKKPSLVDLSLSKIVSGQRGDKNKDWNFTIKFTADKNVKFPAQFNYTGTKSGTLTVSKVSEKPDVYEGTVTLKHNDTITINGIPENTRYEIVEKEANKDRYITTVDGEETGTLQETGTKVTFTNTNLADFDLTVKKNVKGNNVETDKEWDFEIILFSPLVKDLDSTYKYTKNGEDTEYDFNITKNGEGSYVGHILIKGGESATIKGLPEGTRYIVNEVEADQNGYITTTNENTEGVMDKDGIIVEYNNWRFTRHMLSIEKQLKGDNVELDREWNFEIILKVPKDMPFETTYQYTMNNNKEGNIVFDKRVDGTYHSMVQLKGGEIITIKNIPNGVEYQVKEMEANQDGYVTTAENSIGTLTKEEHKVIYTNERSISKVKKVISGISGISNPNTKDEILKYVLMFIISIVGAFGVVIKEYVLKK